MLAAIPSSTTSTTDHLRRAYDEALHAGYLWHEFGDTHLILGQLHQ
jgi:S-adenosylmethionine:tRNA ribosyltransferase-isomerase